MFSIKSKLSFYTISLIIFVVLFNLLGQNLLLNDFFLKNKKADMQATTASILSSYEKNNYLLTRHLKKEIEMIEKKDNIRITLWNENQRWFISPKIDAIDNRITQLHPRPGKKVAEDFKTLIRTRRDFITTVRVDNMDLLISGRVILDSDKKYVGYVLASMHISDISEALKPQTQIAIYFTFFSLLIGIILSLYLSKFFTKPIIEIAETAKKISKGDFSARVETKRHDEIGDLAKVVNDMPEELEKTETFRRDFIANSTHEIKTPITIIQAYSELINDLSDEENIKEFSAIIKDEAEKLNTMAESVLYLSRVESGLTELNKSSFDIVEMASNYIKRVVPLASERNIKLKLDSTKESIYVFADQEKTHQIVSNLIDNAVKYSNQDGTIYVIIDESRFSVKDNGIGISEEDLPHVWDRFYKADKPRGGSSSSSGLGLSIIKQIFILQGFNYGVESQLGKGSTFWFEFTQKEV